MAEHRGWEGGARAQVAGGDASVASTLAALLLASHTFHVVHAGSRTARWKLLAWDTTSHGGHMPEGYHHLTYEDRCQIYALTQSGLSQAAIARQLGVDRSTIKRELDRNAGARGYRFKQAQEKASQRRRTASCAPRKMKPELVTLIEEKLMQEQWSPDQISGWLAKNGDRSISHERIYQHVWEDKKNGGNLYVQLRHHGKKYNKRKGKTSGRGLIPNRVDIDQRPAIVAEKSRIGDWEADTIIGAGHQGAIMSHVERKSKYTKLAKLDASFCRSPVASKRLLTTTEKNSPPERYSATKPRARSS